MRVLLKKKTRAEAMEKAIQAKEVIVTKDEEDGTEFFSFRKRTSGTERGSHSALTITREKKGKQDQALELEDLFGKLEWSYDFKKGDEKKIVQGEKIPPSMSKLLDQAAAAQVRLAGESMKVLKKQLCSCIKNHHCFSFVKL